MCVNTSFGVGNESFDSAQDFLVLEMRVRLRQEMHSRSRYQSRKAEQVMVLGIVGRVLSQCANSDATTILFFNKAYREKLFVLIHRKTNYLDLSAETTFRVRGCKPRREHE